MPSGCCFKCGRRGHYARECYLYSGSGQGSGFGQSATPHSFQSANAQPAAPAKPPAPPRKTFTWYAPPVDQEQARLENWMDLRTLFCHLQPELVEYLVSRFGEERVGDDLIEIFLQLGRRPETIFAAKQEKAPVIDGGDPFALPSRSQIQNRAREFLSDDPNFVVQREHFETFASLFELTTSSGRARSLLSLPGHRFGIDGTVHRVSVIVGRTAELQLQTSASYGEGEEQQGLQGEEYDTTPPADQPEAVAAGAAAEEGGNENDVAKDKGGTEALEGADNENSADTSVVKAAPQQSSAVKPQDTTNKRRRVPPVMPIAITIRVGRTVCGHMRRMLPQGIIFGNQSLLIIGPPGCGKTTLLREFARELSADPKVVVVVVDKTNELAGCGDVPHRSIGSARWLPCATPAAQPVKLLEAVENQSPDVVIVDEISSAQEVAAVRSLAQRGVRIIATVHGISFVDLVDCPTRSKLLGGTGAVTLTDRLAEQRGGRKTVLTRQSNPCFDVLLEVPSRDEWYLHAPTNTRAGGSTGSGLKGPSSGGNAVAEAVDSFLAKESSLAWRLTPCKATPVTAISNEDGFEYVTDATA